MSGPSSHDNNNKVKMSTLLTLGRSFTVTNLCLDRGLGLRDEGENTLGFKIQRVGVFLRTL